MHALLFIYLEVITDEFSRHRQHDQIIGKQTEISLTTSHIFLLQKDLCHVH